VIVDVLRDAADTVAAHFRFAAVGVEHLHASVGTIGGADEYQAVATHAEVSMGNALSQSSGIGGRRLPDAIKIDIVVPRTVHFRESHRGTPSIAAISFRGPKL
jgi:hypothetical protein